MKSNKCFPYSIALPLVFSLGASIIHAWAHPPPILGTGVGVGKLGAQPLTRPNSTWARGHSSRTGGTERPRNPLWGWGKEKTELDFILACHQLPRKASGNLLRASSLNLIPKQETSGFGGSGTDRPAHLACPLLQIPSVQSLIKVIKEKARKIVIKQHLYFKGFLSPSAFSLLLKSSCSPGAQLTSLD